MKKGKVLLQDDNGFAEIYTKQDNQICFKSSDNTEYNLTNNPSGDSQSNESMGVWVNSTQINLRTGGK